MGLVPVEENARERETVEEIGRVVGESVDIGRIVELAKSASPLEEGRGFSEAEQIKAALSCYALICSATRCSELL